ncbi:HAD-IIIA family hydrolase [Pelagibacteraceae bacterium]|nr:HAD-IIIA family hydrolase [Pelagibacteraceae bacterium]
MRKLNKRKTNKIKRNLKKTAVFLDRDGTINYDDGYTYKFSEFRFRPFVLKGLKYLTEKKFLIFIVTNQAGIAKGKFKINDLNKLHNKLISLFIKKKIIINEIKYCPYHPEGIVKKYRKKTLYRKPGNLMIKDLIKKWNVDIKKSFMLGDRKSDELAAKKSKLYYEYVEKNFFNQVKKIVNNY